MDLRKSTKKNLGKDTWYHGTTEADYQNILKKGIKFDINLGAELDFGPGFYLTPEKKMAESYITRQVEFKKSDGLEDFLPPDSFVPVVMEFKINTYSYLEKDEIKILDENNKEFAAFVAENRIRAKEGLLHEFQMIYGLMSDNNPANLVSKFNDGVINKNDVINGILGKTISTKQLSIHTQALCDILELNKAYKVEGGEELNVNDYRNSK